MPKPGRQTPESTYFVRNSGISGCWHTITGAQHLLALRAYLSTATKQHQPIAATLVLLHESGRVSGSDSLGVGGV
jgi:hypothetical protein